MSEAFNERTKLLLGEEATDRVANARVAVFGIGGVGGYVVEALARAGVGTLDLFDPDTISETNINRQLLALHSTVGQYKTDAAAARAKDINPDITVYCHKIFYWPPNADEVDLSVYDYIVDTVDPVTTKVLLAKRAKELGVPIVSCMGTGSKVDATRLQISDLTKTWGCPLARSMRDLGRKNGIKHLRVVWSPEEAKGDTIFIGRGRYVPGSISYVPAAAAMLLAGEVVNNLIAPKQEQAE
jgi:tRNA A37 threonylcarbamoyladenosine dehydratase